jgi:hypothetical protein
MEPVDASSDILPYAGGRASYSAAKPGVTFSFPGNVYFRVEYESSVPDQYLQRSNQILVQYIPRIADVFWTPKVNVTVVMFAPPSGGYAVSYPTVGKDGRVLDLHAEVHIGQDCLGMVSEAASWVHEFTHIFQFTVHDYSFLPMSYVEPTAEAVSYILFYEPAGLISTQSELSPYLADPEFGTARYLYLLQPSSPHRYVLYPGWVELYAFDNYIFTKVNSRLFESPYDASVSEIELQTVIADALGKNSIIDNLALTEWFTVFGFRNFEENEKPYLLWDASLGGEVPNCYFSFAGSIYQKQGDSAVAVGGRGQYTLWDAVTRRLISSGDVNASSTPEPSVKVYVRLREPLNVALFEVQIATDSNKIIRKLFTIYALSTTLGDKKIGLTDSGGWVLPIDGWLTVSSRQISQAFQIHNGTVEFTADRSAAMNSVNLTIQTDFGVYHVFNFVSLPAMSKDLSINLQSSSVICTLFPSSVRPGESVTIIPALVWESSEGDIVLDYSLDGHTWRPIGQPMPPNYLSIWTPQDLGILYVKAAWSGDGGHPAAVSAIQRLVVKIPTGLTIQLSPSTINVTERQATLLTVAITPPLQGRSILIQNSLDGVTWQTIARVYTDSRGDASWSWSPDNQGTYYVRASSEGDYLYMESRSTFGMLTVIPEFPVAALILPIAMLLAIATLRIPLQKRNRIA